MDNKFRCENCNKLVSLSKRMVLIHKNGPKTITCIPCYEHEKDPKIYTGYWFELFKDVDYRTVNFYVRPPPDPYSAWCVLHNGNHVNGFNDKESAESCAQYHAGKLLYKRGEIVDDEVLLEKHRKKVKRYLDSKYEESP